MTDPVPNLGDEATAVLFDAIDFAVQEAETTDSGFVPFALSIAGDGEKTATRYVDDEENVTVEGSVAFARENLRTTDPSTRCLTLAWDRFLTLDEDRTEAVFVGTCELGRPEGVLFAQRYERRGGGLSLIGNPLLLRHRPEPLVPPVAPPRTPAQATPETALTPPHGRVRKTRGHGRFTLGSAHAQGLGGGAGGRGPHGADLESGSGLLPGAG